MPLIAVSLIDTSIYKINNHDHTLEEAIDLAKRILALTEQNNPSQLVPNTTYRLETDANGNVKVLQRTAEELELIAFATLAASETL